MIRNLKALGLIFTSVLVVSIVGASGAQAASDLTVGAPTGTITFSEDVETVLTTTPGTVKCSTYKKVGTYTSSTVFTLTMEVEAIAACKAFGFLSATVSMNGCDTHYSSAPEARTFSAALVCPAGQDVTVTTPGCIIHIEPQTFAGHIVFDNVGGNPPDVTVTYTLEKIKYTETVGCPGVVENKTTENGTLTGALTGKAFNTAGTQVSLIAD